MVRKLEMAEASQEMLRSYVSSLDESNAIHREDIKSLRAELMDVQEQYDRVMTDSEAERATLRVKVSDLEVGFTLPDRELGVTFGVCCVWFRHSGDT